LHSTAPFSNSIVGSAVPSVRSVEINEQHKRANMELQVAQLHADAARERCSQVLATQQLYENQLHSNIYTRNVLAEEASLAREGVRHSRAMEIRSGITADYVITRRADAEYNMLTTKGIQLDAIGVPAQERGHSHTTRLLEELLLHSSITFGHAIQKKNTKRFKNQYWLMLLVN
jgi:hypothetical protein